MKIATEFKVEVRYGDRPRHVIFDDSDSAIIFIRDPLLGDHNLLDQGMEQFEHVLRYFANRDTINSMAGSGVNPSTGEPFSGN